MKEMKITFPDVVLSAMVRNYRRIPSLSRSADQYAWDYIVETAIDAIRTWSQLDGQMDTDMVLCQLACRTDDLIDRRALLTT